MFHPDNLFRLTIETNSAAFHEDGADPHWELSRILNEVASKVLDGDTSGNCNDVNGNHVGSWEVE